jgi:hypothetical protein
MSKCWHWLRLRQPAFVFYQWRHQKSNDNCFDLADFSMEYIASTMVESCLPNPSPRNCMSFFSKQIATAFQLGARPDAASFAGISSGIPSL